MPLIRLVRPTKDTNLFNKNQKCWVLYKVNSSTALHVKGKHRGKGRYIEAWLQPDEYNEIKEFEVDLEFYKMIFSRYGGG